MKIWWDVVANSMIRKLHHDKFRFLLKRCENGGLIKGPAVHTSAFTQYDLIRVESTADDD